MPWIQILSSNRRHLRPRFIPPINFLTNGLSKQLTYSSFLHQNLEFRISNSISIRAQESLKKKLVTEDDYPWRLEDSDECCGPELSLKYVGGLDISFAKDDPSVACGTLVVLVFRTLDVVYEDSSMVKIDVPYVPGFLAFREAPIFLELLEKMKNNSHPFYPQLLMIDGNGILHPRGFGSACHLGVLANLPTIGIGKNLHHVDGLTSTRVRELLEAEDSFNMDSISLIGDSGNTLGVAIRSSRGSYKPIFVSVGHCISLASAVEIVKRTCKYRVPEPIRQADIRSRDHLRKHH